MELCSLEDAFPEIGKQGPSREERRAARKKAKRCKVPAPGDDTDPDRPALRRPEDVPTEGTEIKKAGEVSALMNYGDAFPDLSGVVRDSVPAFRVTKVPEEGFKMPALPGAACSFSDPGLPGYFGKDLDDEEGFADYSANPGDTAGYSLGQSGAGTSASVSGAGVGKAGSGSPTLPAVPTSDAWKPLTPAGARTAYFQELPPGQLPRSRTVERTEPALPMQVVRPQELPRKGGAPVNDPDMTDTTRDQLLKKIQDLSKRLEELETKAAKNSQQDILMFVGAGLVLLVSFDLAMRMKR